MPLDRAIRLRPSLPLAGLALLALARAGAAQSRLTIDPTPADTPRVVGRFAVLLGNAAIGGLTGGTLQTLRGGSFKDGLVRGALGGTVMYAGKRVAVQEFWGAGLLGREINAVGVSMVRNASDGERTWSRLYLPIGPLPIRATLDLVNGFRVAPQLDASAAGWLAAGLLTSGLRLNVAESISSGAPVFEAYGRWLKDSRHEVRAYAVSRSVFLGDPALYCFASPPVRYDVLAHELVHVLQQDFVLTAWSDPFARWALGWFGAGRWTQRYVTVDALGWSTGTASRLMYGADQRGRFPTEVEARSINTRAPRPPSRVVNCVLP